MDAAKGAVRGAVRGAAKGQANLRGERVVLRAVEPSDIDFMYGVENDLENWGVSGTTLPFSQYILERFVESQSDDIHATRQLRLMIVTHDGERVGTMDLFEYDPFNHRAGVGIFIVEPKRNMGYAADALRVVALYAKRVLQLHQLWCGVGAENAASLALFKRAGYAEVGRKREWIWRDGGYIDEVMLQKIL